MLLGLAKGILRQPALGNVVHRQQDHVEVMDAAAREYQDPVPHRGKIPLDFEIRE